MSALAFEPKTDNSSLISVNRLAAVSSTRPPA
jgi:hypothetical protein